MSILAIILLLAAIGNLSMGFFVITAGRQKRLNQLFFAFSFCIGIWVLVNFMTGVVPDLFWIQSAYAFGCLAVTVGFLWFVELCGIKLSKSKLFLILIFGTVFFLMPYDGQAIVANVKDVYLGGYNGDVGRLFPFFAGYVLFLLGCIFYVLFTNYKKMIGLKKEQLSYVLIGATTWLIIISAVSFILPLFGYLSLTPLDSPSSLIFVFLTSIAIIRHKLFDIKIIATELLVFSLWIIILTRTFVAESSAEALTDGGLLILTVIVGIFLIRSVIREVKQRERIQSLADDLTRANENQVTLIHFITHQVKGFFTKSRNIFSLLTEGEAGVLTPEMQRYVNEGFDSDTKGVAMVQDVLNAANIKSGIVQYTMAPFDLSTLVSALVVEYKKMAGDKHVELAYSCWGAADGSGMTMAGKKPANYVVNGDMEQLRQVFKNLIENSIKYTPQGNVTVRLSQSVAESAADHTKAPKIIFSVKDTGVGITDEDKKLLFTQGGHGKDSVKINVESTGYGLYIAKGIVEAHHGRIWAESPGRGQGSAFYVELPGA